MAKAILNALLVFIANIVGIILAPIDILIANVFPQISGLVNDMTFTLTYLWNYIWSYFYWFLSVMPGPLLNAIKVYISVLIVIYTINISVHLVVKVIKIIKNIKFW